MGPFGCSKYDKIFSITGLLKEHERTLTEEKPFECSKYDKIFTITGHLKEHKRTHMEKPFKSTKGDKTF